MSREIAALFSGPQMVNPLIDQNIVAKYNVARKMTTVQESLFCNIKFIYCDNRIFICKDIL
jgi:hypothetical protein